jgi:hypothetical protein
MRKRTTLIIIAVALTALTGILMLRAGPSSATAETLGPALTVYNQGSAQVQDTRTLTLTEGVQTVTVTDIPAQIDPTSVYFKSLTDPAGTFVLEQNYEYDLATTSGLLNKYVGQPIQVITADGAQYDGTLLSGADDVILQDKSGQVNVISRDKVRNLSFPALPGGLVTTPSLVWIIDAKKAGDHQAEISYLTNGIGWEATYALLLAPDGKQLDLSSWVTVNNHSGATYKDARLKLIAGAVNRVQSPQRAMSKTTMAAAEASAPAPQVSQRGFSDYQLYEIGRPVTLKDNEIKQIEFLTASDVPAEKLYTYEGTAGYRYYAGNEPQVDPNYGAQTGNKQVQTVLQFDTGEEGANAELPEGIVRVYQQDVDGNALLIGEDTMPNTPKNEKVRLYLGDAFDIVGERVQTDFKQISDKVVEESFRITVRNQKEKDAVQVRAVEHLYRASDWEITAESAPHTKLDAGTVEWKLDVPAGGETSVTYTVRYRW